MFKQAIKYTFLAIIWKKYRVTLVAALCLVLYFWLVNWLHKDFIAYLTMKETDEYLGLSFLVKWLLFGLGILAYLAFVTFRTRNIERVARENPQSVEEKSKSESSLNEGPDPFAALRDKSKLRSKSDLVIDKYPKKK